MGSQPCEHLPVLFQNLATGVHGEVPSTRIEPRKPRDVSRETPSAYIPEYTRRMTTQTQSNSRPSYAYPSSEASLPPNLRESYSAQQMYTSTRLMTAPVPGISPVDA